MCLSHGIFISNTKVIYKTQITKDAKSITKSIQLSINDIIMFLDKDNQKSY